MYIYVFRHKICSSGHQKCYNGIEASFKKPNLSSCTQNNNEGTVLYCTQNNNKEGTVWRCAQNNNEEVKYWSVHTVIIIMMRVQCCILHRTIMRAKYFIVHNNNKEGTAWRCAQSNNNEEGTVLNCARNNNMETFCNSLIKFEQQLNLAYQLMHFYIQ